MAYSLNVEVSLASLLKSLGVPLTVLLISFYSFGGSLNNIKGYNKLFFQLVSVSIVLVLLPYFGAGFTLFDRLSLYFSVPAMLLIPNSLANLKKHKLLHYLILIPLICFFYLLFLNGLAQYGFNINFDFFLQ